MSLLSTMSKRAFNHAIEFLLCWSFVGTQSMNGLYEKNSKAL